MTPPIPAGRVGKYPAGSIPAGYLIPAVRFHERLLTPLVGLNTERKARSWVHLPPNLRLLLPDV